MSINQSTFAFVPVFLWLSGSICFAQSKGYSQWYGALGFFWFVGLLALILLPDNWPEVEQQATSPTNYPRYPQG